MGVFRNGSPVRVKDVGKAISGPEKPGPTLYSSTRTRGRVAASALIFAIGRRVESHREV